MAIARRLLHRFGPIRVFETGPAEDPSGMSGGTLAPSWSDLFHVLALITVLVAATLGTLTIPQTTAAGVVLLLAGYAALLLAGPRRFAVLRRADLVVVLDLIVVTSLMLVSGNLNSPFVYLYYLVILEGALRLPLRQALAASIATAGLIILLWLYGGNADILRGPGFRLGAVIAGGFLLALFLGTLVQEHETRRKQATWAALLDRRLREATQQLEAQLAELQFYNALASELSGELRTDGVTRTLLRFLLKATGLPRGLAYVIADDGTPHPAAAENVGSEDGREPAPVDLTFPKEAGAGDPIVVPMPDGGTATGAVFVPLVRGGSIRAWLCGLAADRPRLEESAVRLVRRIAAEGAVALEAALLYEEVQRIMQADPMRSLFAWPALEKLVGTEVERCRQLCLVFSLAEIQLEDYGTAPAPPADRELAVRRAVNLIQASLRRVDLLSYDGAGRFAILLPRMPKVHAMEQLQAIVARLENDPVAIRLLMVDRLVLAAGVVTFPEDGADASSLFASVEGVLVRGPHHSPRAQIPAT